MDNQQVRIENIDYVVCKICEKKMKQITYKHLASHDLSSEEYQKMFPNSKIRCENSKNKHLSSQIKTNQQKYGVDRPLQNKEFHDKMEKSVLRKYGVNNPYKIEDVKNKSRKTCMKRYGAYTPLQSELYSKIQEAAQKESSKIKRKNTFQKTCIKKYGVNHNWKNSEVREKIKLTLLKKYGVDNSFKIEGVMQKACTASLKKTPNRPETILLNIVQDKGWFSGGGTFWVRFKNGKYKNPDIKIHGCKKVIEHFGDYWHKGEDSNLIINQYKEIGYSCLIIWEHELNDVEKVKNKVINFINQ